MNRPKPDRRSRRRCRSPSSASEAAIIAAGDQIPPQLADLAQLLAEALASRWLAAQHDPEQPQEGQSAEAER